MKLAAVLKSALLWSPERGTWQYDLLCLLILAFIFLTPSSWFTRSDERSHGRAGVERHEPHARPSPQSEKPDAKEFSSTRSLDK